MRGQHHPSEGVLISGYRPTDEDQASFNLAHVFQLSGKNWASKTIIIGLMLTSVESYEP